MNASMHAAPVLGKPLSSMFKAPQLGKPYACTAQAVHHTSEPDNHNAVGVSFSESALLIVYTTIASNQGLNTPSLAQSKEGQQMAAVQAACKLLLPQRTCKAMCKAARASSNL
jgi:hypothetical protein